MVYDSETSYLVCHPYRMIIRVSRAVKCDTRGMIERMTSTRIEFHTVELKYIHSEKVFCFFLITFVKLKGTCHETYHMIAKVDPVLLVKFGGVW